jgi:hypothetical protein
VTPAFSVGKVAVYEADQALAWLGPLKICVDGAPDAYALPGSGVKARDFLGNAHKDPHDLSSPWCGVVLDEHGQPVVQQPGDPCPGALVSQTALQDPTHLVTSQLRYVNAIAVPYYVLSPEMERAGAHLGDLLYCINVENMHCGAALFGDIGPHGKLGEGSPNLADALCVPSDAKRGGCDRNAIACVAFKDSASHPAWPRDVSEFSAAAAGLLAAWGGLSRLLELVQR